MRHGALSGQYIFIVYNVNHIDGAQEKKLLTKFVLPLASDTAPQDQVPCILDEQRHHSRLHHHQPSIQAMKQMLDPSKLKISTYLFLEHKFLYSLNKILSDHDPGMSPKG
jgi:hypothetical protein